MISNITLFIGIMLMYSTPLVFAALGGVITERAGVTNLGIEGMMSLGAFVGAAAAYSTGNPWIGFAAAGLVGGVVAFFHAFASITCRADQTISGIAINMIGPGLALFLCRLMYDGATMTHPITNKIPKIFGSTLKGALGNLNVDVTVVIALIFAILIWFLLYKTKWGLHIRAVGEHPAAADTMGINVFRTRYVCTVASGVLAGFGGGAMTLAIISQFNPTAISGQGFIALAAVIFGKWTPHGAYGACLLFGGAQALTVILGGGAFAIPSEILAILPYVLTIVILILFVGRSAAPKASGVPYEKGAR